MLAVEESTIAASEEILQEEAQIKRKKKQRFWGQRDSLARRNKLLVGKEGSRRRQRWDNNNFTNHPLAVLDSDDMRPPGYGPDRPSFHWIYDEIDLAALDNLDWTGRNDNRSLNVPLSRKMRQILKRTHVPEGLVIHYELELLEFMRKRRITSQEWLRDEMYLVWEISDPFSRWIVHAMCQYYCLSSFSKTTTDNRRLTFVCHPEHELFVFGGGPDVLSPDTDIVEPNVFDWMAPEQLFSEYVC
ncbi:hypothetical protein DFQ28_005770 [Apophysomyces sp. BC1034]|nr:hypothetical protein DFQ28_005770 [Apophysomyces sp. BC1034]